MRLKNAALVTSPRYVQYFSEGYVYFSLYSTLFHVFVCISPRCVYFFRVNVLLPFLFISSPALTYFPRTFSLSHFCVFKRGRSGCPLYHKLTVFLPQFFFPLLYLLFMGMLFFMYLYNTLLVLYTSPSKRLSMFTLFLCLPHLFLLSSKCKS